ncbi:hypothetical protein FRB96_002745 [Tulasnella sp. 330]|nr:hypothetical protein FRB96_002745 [Tulasnella sp. 330]KAG8869968.1 hypothetical protein FRB98_002030 [Tulasnella sp. 332]
MRAFPEGVNPENVPEFTPPTSPQSGEIKLGLGNSRRAALMEMKKDVYYIQDFISKNIVDKVERERFRQEQIKTASGRSWIRDLLGSGGHAKTKDLYDELRVLKLDLETLGTRRVLAQAELRKEAAEREGRPASVAEHLAPQPLPRPVAPQAAPDWSFIDAGPECSEPMEPDGYLNDADVDSILQRSSRAS